MAGCCEYGMNHRVSLNKEILNYVKTYQHLKNGSAHTSYLVYLSVSQPFN
jgi:hypothetical protein